MKSFCKHAGPVWCPHAGILSRRSTYCLFTSNTVPSARTAATGHRLWAGRAAPGGPHACPRTWSQMTSSGGGTRVIAPPSSHPDDIGTIRDALRDPRREYVGGVTVSGADASAEPPPSDHLARAVHPPVAIVVETPSVIPTPGTSVGHDGRLSLNQNKPLS